MIAAFRSCAACPCPVFVCSQLTAPWKSSLEDAFVRMLHFNAPPPALGGRLEEDTYKVLILDRVTQDILAPLLHVNELRRHGVTLHMLLDTDRQPIPDVPAVYFVQPTEAAVDRIVADAARGLYDSFHLNFSTHVPRPLMERLANGVAASGAAARVARVYDQHAQFVSLEPGLFTLGLPSTYLDLNDPGAQDTAIEAAVGAVVEGLFCALATLSVVPIIRCPPGGAAEHVAAQLDARLRDALRGRANLFAEGAAGGGLAASLQRPSAQRTRARDRPGRPARGQPAAADVPHLWLEPAALVLRQVLRQRALPRRHPHGALPLVALPAGHHVLPLAVVGAGACGAAAVSCKYMYVLWYLAVIGT